MRLPVPAAGEGWGEGVWDDAPLTLILSPKRDGERKRVAVTPLSRPLIYGCLMRGLIACLDALERIRHPSDLSLRRDGKALAATISPASHGRQKIYASRHLALRSCRRRRQQLTFGPRSDALCRYSPRDDRLAFASDRDLAGKMALFLLEGHAASGRGRWAISPARSRISAGALMRRSLIVLAADRGLDAAATSGAMRLAWGNDEDPAVTNPLDARRRLYRVTIADGKALEIGPADLTVWEFDLLGDHEAIAIVSSDASERGWYHAKLARIDFATRKADDPSCTGMADPGRGSRSCGQTRSLPGKLVQRSWPGGG